MELYDRLGVSENASESDIKKAYRSRSKDLHPDKGGDPSEFHDLSLAYKILSDISTRKLYDETGGYETNTTPIDRLVRERLISAFDMLFNKYGEEIIYIDLMAKMEHLLIQINNDLLKTITKAENKIKLIDKTIWRITTKVGDNLFVMVLSDKRKKSKLAILNNQKEIEITNLMMVALTDFDFKFEEKYNEANPGWDMSRSPSLGGFDLFQT